MDKEPVSVKDDGDNQLVFNAFLQRCRRTVTWVVLLALLAVVVAVPYLWGRIDEEIRRRTLAMVAQHYSDLDVSLRSAARVEGTGIVLRGMSIRASA